MLNDTLNIVLPLYLAVSSFFVMRHPEKMTKERRMIGATIAIAIAVYFAYQVIIRLATKALWSEIDG
jgi:hypothetical protein